MNETRSIALAALMVLGLMMASPLLAEGISIGGTDGSAQMGNLRNMATTLQNIGFKWIAPLIGGFLVISGIVKITARDFMQGIISITCGGSLFFVEKIIEALSKMSGN